MPDSLSSAASRQTPCFLLSRSQPHRPLLSGPDFQPLAVQGAQCRTVSSHTSLQPRFRKLGPFPLQEPGYLTWVFVRAVLDTVMEGEVTLRGEQTVQ